MMERKKRRMRVGNAFSASGNEYRPVSPLADTYFVGTAYRQVLKSNRNVLSVENRVYRNKLF